MEEKKTGRPTKATPETITLLLEAFAKGSTVEEACNSAQIGETTFFEWMNKDLTFRSKVVSARNMLDNIVVGNIARQIMRGDLDTSKWWAERRMKNEFSTRSELTGKDGENLIPKPILGGVTEEK